MTQKKFYKRSLAEGNLKWLDVDITNLYKALGGDTNNRKYFSILGHFKDPMKFISHPIRSAKHKGSVVFGIFMDALTGTDWSGKRFTTLPEITGFDFEKGKYKTSRRGKHKKGDPKWGRLKGQTVVWDYSKHGPIQYDQIPSYLISQARGAQPVQVQNLMAWMAGEMDGFDAVMKSLGMNSTSTFNNIPLGEDIEDKKVQRKFREEEDLKKERKKRNDTSHLILGNDFVLCLSRDPPRKEESWR